MVAYVQQKIDNILCKVQAWAGAYVNNIFCSARSPADLFDKLKMLFEIFLHYHIFIKPTKLFLNYLDVGFLRQRVHSLGLTTSQKKLKAIRLFAYLSTLKSLEYYLGLTRYLQNYIHFYAQLVVLLQ